MADVFDQAEAKTGDVFDQAAKIQAGPRRGATGSWGGFTEGVKDAVSAPFKKENWKSLTDNPIVNPLRNQMETPDLATPENKARLNASSADLKNRQQLIEGGHSPVSPYEAGHGVASGVMAGAPNLLKEFGAGFREGWEAAGTKAKSTARGANAPWRKLPGPSTPTPQSTESIPSKLPSGRTPGGVSDPRTIPETKPPSTADKLPRWHMIRDQVKGKGPEASGIPGELPSGRKVPAPGARGTVDAPAVDELAKSAAELMKAVGIGPDEILKATPEQWKMIEQQVGSTFDRQAAIKELQAMSKEPAKPSPKASESLGSGPKTPKPSPGGEKVESTVTPEARAARAEDHATKLAAALRKLPSSDRIPEPGNDAAWKVLEDQTGTEATPAVRKAAIDKAKKLWTEGPRSAGDLQRRRAEYFAKNPTQ